MSWLRTYQLLKKDSDPWSVTVSQWTKCDLWNNKTVFKIWQPQRPIFETGSQPNSTFKQANLVVPIFTYYIKSKIWIRQDFWKTEPSSGFISKTCWFGHKIPQVQFQIYLHTVSLWNLLDTTQQWIQDLFF
jgi:hypothetical protein